MVGRAPGAGAAGGRDRLDHPPARRRRPGRRRHRRRSSGRGWPRTWWAARASRWPSCRAGAGGAPPGGRAPCAAWGRSRGWLALALPGAAAAWLLESVLVWPCAGWAGHRRLARRRRPGHRRDHRGPDRGRSRRAASGPTRPRPPPRWSRWAPTRAPRWRPRSPPTRSRRPTPSSPAASAPSARPRGCSGRLRLARRPPQPPAAGGRAAGRPGRAVAAGPRRGGHGRRRRGPRADASPGRPVRVVVVDDGSPDATAAPGGGGRRRAWCRPAANRGPGRRRAPRAGRGRPRAAPAAVAFCDADGEYAPEELAALVAPILAGEADYVVGSRFVGRIEHMRPHRRLGNLVLTPAAALRRPAAASPTARAATGPCRAPPPRDAEIVHDFNYAQVLTLDLLAKGFRYAEVPISYRFRSTAARSCASAATCAGSCPRSTASWATRPGSVLHDVRGEARAGARPRRSASKAPSRPRQSAAAQAMARAWWALSWTNSPWRPSVSRAGCAAAQASSAASRPAVAGAQDRVGVAQAGGLDPRDRGGRRQARPRAAPRRPGGRAPRRSRRPQRVAGVAGDLGAQHGDGPPGRRRRGSSSAPTPA